MSALLRKHDFDMVLDTQGVFRLVLEAVSNPTRLVHIGDFAKKIHAPYPALLALAMTLLDNEVSFYTDEEGNLSEEITALTLSHKGIAGGADFIFITNEKNMTAILEEAKIGTHINPHESATIFILDDRPVEFQIQFDGPGIEDNTTMGVSKTVHKALELRDHQFYTYPQGVDLIFVSSVGDIFAIPRLIRWEVQ